MLEYTAKQAEGSLCGIVSTMQKKKRKNPLKYVVMLICAFSFTKSQAR